MSNQSSPPEEAPPNTLPEASRSEALGPNVSGPNASGPNPGGADPDGSAPSNLSQHQSAWPDWVTQGWQQVWSRVGEGRPFAQVTQMVTGWFSVSEAEIGPILESIRANLPTTEAILIGKPQSGKSSVVRGLTGVSADIIGQGFRPHTQHTGRYAYPSEQLPLLLFTDTVGLGDIAQETEAIIEELR